MENIEIQEEQLSQEPQAPLQQDPPSKKLWQGLVEDKLYSKSFEEFQKQYSNKDALDRLHSGLLEDKLYSKSRDEFENQYFPELKKKAKEVSIPSSKEPSVGVSDGTISTPKPKQVFDWEKDLLSDKYFNKPNRTDATYLAKPLTGEKIEQAERGRANMKLAIENTTERALKAKGIKTPKNSPTYLKQKKKIEDAVKNEDAAYTIDPITKQPALSQTTGFFESMWNGFKSAINDESESDDFVNKMTTKERVDYANKKLSEIEITEDGFIGKKPSAIGRVGEIVGGVAPFAAKATAGAMAGAGLVAAAPETAGASLAGLPTVMSFAFTTPDMINQGAKNEVLRRYSILKQQNPNSPDEFIMKQAEKGLTSGGITGAITNLAFTGIGTKPLTQIGSKAISNEAKLTIGKYVGNILKSGAHLGTIVSGTEAAKEIEAGIEDKRLRLSPSQIAENATNNFVDNATVGVVLHTLTTLPQLPGAIKSTLKWSLKNENPADLTQILKTNEDIGNIPKGTAEKVMSDINGYNEALKKTSDDLTPESQASVAGLIQKRDKLKAEMATKDETQVESYNEQIKSLDEQIKEITKTNNPFEFEVNEVGEKINGEIKPAPLQKGVEGKIEIPERPKEEGEPEQISKPIELSLEPIKVGEEVPQAEIPVAEEKPTLTAIEQEETIKQMKPFTDRMVEIERDFKNEGFEIDTDYDNEIVVTDKDGEIVDAEELPENLRKLAGDYEKATMKLGEFDASAREKALAESRKVMEAEAEVVEPKKAELPPTPEKATPKAGEELPSERENWTQDDYKKELKRLEKEDAKGNADKIKQLQTELGAKLIADLKKSKEQKQVKKEKVTKEESRTQEALNKYEEGEGTFNDLVDEVEAIALDENNQNLKDAVDAYREEQRLDIELKGRGDMDAAESAFMRQIKSELPPTPEKVTPKVEEEITPKEAKEGDTVELPSQVKGGLPRTMIFSEGEWKQKVGDNITNVGENVKQQAQAAFEGIKAEVTPEVKPTEPTVEEAKIEGKETTAEGKFVKVANNQYSDGTETKYIVPTSNSELGGHIEVSKEVYEKWKELDDAEKMRIDRLKKSTMGSESQRQKSIRGTAMAFAAEKRKILGTETAREMSAKEEKENKVRINDKATINNIEYTVLGFPYGKIKLSTKSESGVGQITIERGSDIEKEILKQKPKETTELKGEHIPNLDFYLSELNKEKELGKPKVEAVKPTKPKEPTAEKVEPKPEFPKEEKIAEKTPLQKASEARRAAKAKLDSLRKGLGINEQAKLEALVDYHRTLVAEAKEFIKEKAGDINEWAKSIGEKVNVVLQKAWDEAKGAKPVEKAEDLGYGIEDISEPIVGITKKDIKERAAIYNVEIEERREKMTDAEVEAMAKDLIQNGYDVDGLVKEALAPEKRPLTDIEANILAEVAAAMENKIDENSSDADIRKYRDVLSALNKGISENARGLRMAKVKKNKIESIADVMADMMEDNLVDELTPEQRKEAKKRYEDVKKALDNEVKLRKQAEDEIDRLKAELEIERQKKKSEGKPRKSNQEYTDERKQLIQSIKDKWKNAGKGKTYVTLPYAPQLIAIAPDVARLVKSYIDQGSARTLDQVRSLLKKDIEEAGITVTDEDVRNLIAGNYTEKKPTRNQLSKQLFELRQEEKLLLQLEALERGEKPTTEKKKIERNQKLADLRNKIKELTGKDMNEEFIRTVKAQITANKNKQQKTQDRIKRGDFSPEEKKQSILENEQLKALNRQLYDDYLKSILDKDEALLDYEKKRVEDKMKNRTKLEKLGGGIDVLLTTSKGTVAMFDQSVFLVQMLPFALSHPLKTIQFAVKSIRDFSSKTRFDENMALLHGTELYKLIEKTGLAIYEPRSAKSELRNELHGGDKNLWNKEITVGGKKYSVGQAFERATTSALNNARLYLFMSRVQDLYDAGKTFENSPKEFEAAARFINEFTGHGKVQEDIAKSSQLLNKFIWSPKMFSSTLNILGLGDIVRPVATANAIGRRLGITTKESNKYKGFYTSLTPEQGKFAARQLTRFIGGGIMLMVATKLASMMNGDDDDDVKIDIDPRSSNFGSMKIKNKPILVYGRFGSAVRTIVQSVGGVRVVKGEEDVIGDKYGEKTSGDIVFGSFVRGKTTPFAGFAYDFILNNRKNYYTKEEMTPKTVAKQLIVPMSIQDVIKDFDRDGGLVGTIETVLKFYGAPIKDDRDFEKASKNKAKKKKKPSSEKKKKK